MKRAKRIAALVVLASGLSLPMALAQEGARTLPTLLIKGEVVSLDTNDPNGTLMKVKDRYGFETPIFVTGRAKFFRGEEEVLKDSLQAGAEVEVEYNFDINTAKRYAVVVKLLATETQATAASKPVPAAEAQPTVVEQAVETPAGADSAGKAEPAGAVPPQ